MKKIFTILICVVFLCIPTLHAQTCHLTIKNPSAYQRQEVVEIPVASLQKKLGNAEPKTWQVHDKAGLEIVSQITYDNFFLIPIELLAHSSYTFTVSVGTPAKYIPTTFIKMYPNREDDIAWENDCIAFRTYGPALQKTGERSFGFDVWVKNTPDWVVNYRYALQLSPKIKARIEELRKKDPKEADELIQRISYHIDHGNGLDCYKVGPSLGCGAPALLDEKNNIVYPWCYETYKILDNGPLRVTMRLQYEKKEIPHIGAVRETRVISLDKYSQLNRMKVNYDYLKIKTNMVAGLVVHAGDTTHYKLNIKNNWMSYIDPTDTPKGYNGKIFVGCVFLEKVKKMELRRFSSQESKELREGDFGHLLAIHELKPSNPTITYYWGAAWNKYNFNSPQEWNSYLEHFAESLKHPLQIKIK
jgi:hypothetical protein